MFALNECSGPQNSSARDHTFNQNEAISFGKTSSDFTEIDLRPFGIEKRKGGQQF